MALNGVWLAGLSTTGQPAAIAGATLWATRLSGKLNGLIAPTTPIGHAQREADLALAAGDGVERHDLAGQRAGLGGGELERADRPLGLDACRLDRLGRLVGDDLGELVAPLGRAARAAVSRISARFHARQRPAGQRAPWPTATARSTSAGAARPGTRPISRAVVRRRDGGRLGAGEALAGQRECAD